VHITVLFLVTLYLEKSDVDEFEDIAAEFKVTSLPHIIFYDNSIRPQEVSSYVGSDIAVITEKVKDFADGSLQEEATNSGAAIEPTVPQIEEVIFSTTQCLALPTLSLSHDSASSVFVGTGANDELRALMHILIDMDPSFRDQQVCPSAGSRSLVATAFTSSTRITSDIDRVDAASLGGR
jgi:hypothetical protein